MFRKSYSPIDDQTVMFDDPKALRSDWHDSTALGKYHFVPLMCNNSFYRVKFPNCLKHNISIQMSIQSINDEWYISQGNGYEVPKGTNPHDYRYQWSLRAQPFNLVIWYKEPHNSWLWIPIIVRTFLSMAQPMKLGTNSPNLYHQKMHIILFWTWRTYRMLVLYTKVKLISNLFFLNCTYPRNVIPKTLCPRPIYKVQSIFRVHILLCDQLEIMSLDTGAFFVTTTSPKDQRGANNKC